MSDKEKKKKNTPQQDPDASQFMEIQSIGRARLIDEIKGLDRHKRDEVVEGIGDDAAVLKLADDKLILTSSETFAEGVDFDLTYTPLHHLGYKIIAGAVSDIYAMNGNPVSVNLNLSLPNKISVQMIRQFYTGVESACNDFDIELSGGDMKAAPQLMVCAVSVTGEVAEKDIIYRRGAHKEDALCVTGDLGGAMAGLRILMREKAHWQEHGQEQFQPDLADYEYVVKRQLVPTARKDFIELLEKEQIKPSSMIDVSQGLAHDLYQLAKASDVGAYLYQAAIPIAIETRQVADEMKEDVDRYAFYGGEDLELMFTVPKDTVDKLAEVFNDFAVIGKITDASEGLKMQTPDGDYVIFDEDADGQ